MGWLDHDRLGFNYRLSDVASRDRPRAARPPRRHARRARARRGALSRGARAASRGSTLPCADSGRRPARLVRLRRAGAADGPARDDVVVALREHGVQSKPYLPAIHLMSLYRERFGHREGEFPVCEDVAARSVALPFFPEMTDGQVERVATALRACSSGAPRLARHVALRRAPGSGLRVHQPLARRRSAALARTTSRSRAPTRACSPRRASSATTTATRCSPGLDAVEAELRDGHVPVPRGRRGHPHGGRAPPDRDRRPRRRQAPHRALAQRPGRHRRRAVRPRGAPTRRSSAIADLMAALLDAAEAHLDWPLPGYTHLQRAQPVYLGHHLLAYVWMLERDRERFALRAARRSRTCRSARARSPGVNFDTDRRMVAAELGFERRRAELARRGRQPRLRPRLDRRGRDLRDAPLAPRRASSCCGRARSSASCGCRTRGRAAARSCRRRRTPTPPSCCARRRRASSGTCPRCTASCTRCR